MIKIVAMETPSMSYLSNFGEMERIEDVEKLQEYFHEPEDNLTDDDVFYGCHVCPDSREEKGLMTFFSLYDLIEEDDVMVGNTVFQLSQFF